MDGKVGSRGGKFWAAVAYCRPSSNQGKTIKTALNAELKFSALIDVLSAAIVSSYILNQPYQSILSYFGIIFVACLQIAISP